MRTITGLGGYLPLMRFERQAAAEALRWSGLGGARKGRRTVAAWDEDALTLAVEAGRLAVPPRLRGSVVDVVHASTSAPFLERQASTILAEALNLTDAVATMDVAGSRRCALSALRRALAGSEGGTTLIAVGEARPTRAGSAAHAAYGDGAAAVAVGEAGFARLLGSASRSRDFLDIYRSPDHPFPYAAEERFVRDVAAAEIVTPTLAAALADAGVAATDVRAVAVHEPVSGIYKLAAAALGLAALNQAEPLSLQAGDLGAAHSLFALALALDAAEVGDRILVAAFGSGCEALVLEKTAHLPTEARSATTELSQGVATSDYVRFLTLSGALSLDWGARSEFEQKIQPSVLARYGRAVTGFVGGRDPGGNVQFPKSVIPVAPGLSGPALYEDTPLADAPARVLSVTADRLIYSPDPPFVFGLVQFDNGARLLMEFVDTNGEALAADAPLRMRFRIKSIDESRGFKTYFWKAAPLERPPLEI